MYIWYAKVGTLKRNVVYIPLLKDCTHISRAQRGRQDMQVCMLSIVSQFKLSGQPSGVHRRSTQV